MKTANLHPLVARVDGSPSASDAFHEKTAIGRLSTLDLADAPTSWTTIHFKTYPRLDRIPLPVPVTQALTEAIRGRRSRRDFSGQPIGPGKLASILHGAGGLIPDGESIDDSRRPYPSAGARYPLEIYSLVLTAEGLSPGLYHYNVREHVLEILLEQDLRDDLEKATGELRWIGKASVVLIVTAVLDRTRIKYGDRGYRYALLEAGHLAQNMCLIAHADGLISCCLGGFIDDRINAMLDILLVKERAIYLVAIGQPCDTPRA
jgi:SagB-type dehydrogenase family enzyme